MVTVIYMPSPAVATSSSYGVVKFDNDTIKIDENGRLYVARVPE